MVSPGAGLWHRHGDQVQPRSWAARLRGVLARAGQAPGPGDADRDHAKVIAGARRAGGQLAGVALAAGCSLPRAGSSSPVRPAGRADSADGRQRPGSYGQHGMPVQAAPQPRPVLVQAGDRARKNLNHHPDYILAAYMTSGT